MVVKYNEIFVIYVIGLDFIFFVFVIMYLEVILNLIIKL